MYTMSDVMYQLANGSVVTSLKEAKQSKQSYSIIYKPIYEEYDIPATTKLRRRSLV